MCMKSIGKKEMKLVYIGLAAVNGVYEKLKWSGVCRKYRRKWSMMKTLLLIIFMKDMRMRANTYNRCRVLTEV